MRRNNALNTEVRKDTQRNSESLCNPVILLCVLFAFAFGCNRGPSPPKSPEEELASFQINDGLQVQLVASEPMVEDPVFITFDEDNRLWVVEMRGFMPDVYGKGEDERVGRISILQDTTGDGIMDISTIFIDELIMPRALAVVKGGALLAEDQKLWFAPDADRDMHADGKELIDSTYGGPPLPEHSPNGLFRGLDNWYYNAKSSLRYKLIGDKWIRDSTEFRGQWGISHDDQGRLFYNYNWSQLHADLVPPNYLSRNPHHKPTTGIDHGVTLDRRVYPIRPNPAVNRGYIPGTLDDKGRLLEFTAACSPFVYRAHALPDEYYGNAFVAEPSGNLVKRNVVVDDSAVLRAYDPHPGREFMASTDERFRPVSITSGPDGALYITDMYRGLVQHEKYVTPYLREQTLKRKLEQPRHYGRIWRVVPSNWSQPAPVRLSTAASTELVGMLAGDNGWMRDIAQRLIVERRDSLSFPVLRQAITNSPNSLQRIHALWTLEGLGQLDPVVLMRLQWNSDEMVSNNALRLLEPFLLSNSKLRGILTIDLGAYDNDATYWRMVQLALSAHAFNRVDRLNTLYSAITPYADSALMRDAVMSSLKDEEFNFLKKLRSLPPWQASTQGKEIFIETLATATFQRGDVAEMSRLLIEGATDTWHSRAILTGIANAKTRQQLYADHLPQMLDRPHIDTLLRARLLRVLDWSGKPKNSPAYTSELSDRDQARFIEGRRLYLTSCAACHGTNGTGMPRLGPTLVGSEWVLGDERRLALLVLHGIEGPIEVNGKRYDVPEILPVMPSHSTLDDGVITSILIYIRNEWGNNAGPVSGRTVGQTRHLTQGRVQPWTVEELNSHVADTTRRE